MIFLLIHYLTMFTGSSMESSTMNEAIVLSVWSKSSTGSTDYSHIAEEDVVGRELEKARAVDDFRRLQQSIFSRSEGPLKAEQ